MDFKDLNLEQLVTNQDSDKLSTLLDEWDKKIRDSDATLQIVEENYIGITKEMVEMRNDLSNKRQEQLDCEDIKRKGLHNLRVLKSEKATIERSFWKSRNR